MATRPAILTAFAPWQGRPNRTTLESEIAEALTRATEAPFRFLRHEGAVIVEYLDLRGLLAVLDVGCRGQAWRCGLCLRPPPNPTMAALRAVRLARQTPWGLALRNDRTDPRIPAVNAALALHVSLLRQRTPAAWRMIDAVRVHRDGTAAAAALGCSQQAVSKQLIRSNAKATALTGRLLGALLEADPASDRPLRERERREDPASDLRVENNNRGRL